MKYYLYLCNPKQKKTNDNMNKKMVQEKGKGLHARKNSHGSRLFYLFVGLIIALPTQAQMLFSENTANLNLLINRNRVVNLIDKLEFSTYGKKITVSGGYVHAEYRYLLHHAFEVYPYVESQWAGSRGMTFKVSSGLQSRYRLVNSTHCLMFAAIGVFYEFEKWEYPDPPVGISDHAYSRSVKSHLSLSFRHSIGEHWELTTTAIHQAKPDSYTKCARFGGAVDLAYHITPKIGIRGTYRIIYDTSPIVPIRKDYTTVDAGIDIAF